MRKIKIISFWSLLTVSMATVVFNSCSKNDNSIVSPNSIAVTGISLDKSALSLLVGEEQTLTVTVIPDSATVKNVEWTSSDVSKATVTTGKVTAVSAGTTVITVTIDNQTDICTINIKDVKDGVRINGIIWSTRNVDKAGTFASAPENAGMFYQWNRKIAWPATGDRTEWDNTVPEGDTWEKVNDPCPAGWRIPTLDEINTLQDADKVTSELTTINGVNGRKYTDIATNNSLFLPAAGYRNETFIGNSSISRVDDAGAYGYYWSSTQYNNDCCAFNLGFNCRREGGYRGIYFDKMAGLSVRPVAE